MGHEELLKVKGKEVIREITSLLNMPVKEASMDIKHLNFEPLLSPATFQDAESVGYVKVRFFAITISLTSSYQLVSFCL